jgi:alcohol dehydrogenase (NADP+)
MKTLTFSNGDRMPILGLGTWKSAPGEVYTAVREAIRIGYRHIDCALLYGNEAEIGNALRDAMADGEVARQDLWITSKLWGNAHGRDEMAGAIAQTLRDLGLEYLDLYLIHWPVPLKPSVAIPASADDFHAVADMPLRSTWQGMEGLVRAGLTRHIGVSNFSVAKLRGLMADSTIKVEANQVELHPLLQQSDLVAYCAEHNIHVTAYSPLGSFDRPDFLKAAGEPTLLDNPVILSIAEARGCTPAQVLIAWHIHRGVSVIPKSVRVERLRENFASTDVALTAGDMQQIQSLDRHYRFLDGGFWAQPGSPWTLKTLWDEARVRRARRSPDRRCAL